jgi:hypothetical protein
MPGTGIRFPLFIHWQLLALLPCGPRRSINRKVVNEVPTRRKLNFDQILALLMTTCPHCHSEIQFAQCKRVDGNYLECGRCRGKFQPKSFEERGICDSEK